MSTFPSIPKVLPAGQAGEEYAVVPDWPMYCVGTYGTVWSRWNGPWERLEPFPTTSGHMGVNLIAAHSNKVRRRFYLQVLMALSFIGPPPFADAQVRHLDDDKENNALTNLEYGTRGENNRDRTRNRSRHQGTD